MNKARPRKSGVRFGGAGFVERIRGVAWGALFLAAGSGLVGCDQIAGGRPSKAKNGEGATSTTLELAARGAVKREFTVAVRAEPIQRREVKAYVSTIGSVAPIQSAPVAAEAAGRLKFERAWLPDDPVEEGQIIAHIDDRDLRAEIEIAERMASNAQSARDLAQAQLAQARHDLETTKELVARDLQPRRQLDEAMMAVRTATTNLAQAENNARKADLDLQVARKKSEQMTLAAPMAGFLCSREVIEKEQGKNLLVNSRDVTTLEDRMVAPGAVVCGVLDLSKVVVRSDVTSKDIAQVALGAGATARVYVGERNVEAEGKVAAISSVINPETRAFQVDVLLDNPDGRLRPGMFARVDIVTSVRRDAIAVPRGALQKRNNLDVVFVIDKDSYAAMRPVKLGIENPTEVEVVEGLREGDELIVMGHETLQDHIRVEKAASGEPAPGQAAPGAKAVSSSQPASS